MSRPFSLNQSTAKPASSEQDLEATHARPAPRKLPHSLSIISGTADATAQPAASACNFAGAEQEDGDEQVPPGSAKSSMTQIHIPGAGWWQGYLAPQRLPCQHHPAPPTDHCTPAALSSRPQSSPPHPPALPAVPPLHCCHQRYMYCRGPPLCCSVPPTQHLYCRPYCWLWQMYC